MFGGEDCDPIDAPEEHAANRLLQAGAVKIGVGHQQFLFVLDQQFFEDLDEFREEGVGQIRNDDSVNLALALLEMNGAGVGNELEVGDDFANARGGFVGHQFGPVDDPGDRGAGDAGKLGDLAHADGHDTAPCRKCPRYCSLDAGQLEL